MSQSQSPSKSTSAASPKTLDEAFAQITDELLQVFLKKHKDYGKENILSIEELGISMRILEKTQRLKNLLMSQDQPANESIEDTWTDIAVYAIIGMLYRRQQFQDLNVKPELLKEF